MLLGTSLAVLLGFAVSTLGGGLPICRWEDHILDSLIPLPLTSPPACMPHETCRGTGVSRRPRSHRRSGNRVLSTLGLSSGGSVLFEEKILGQSVKSLPLSSRPGNPIKLFQGCLLLSLLCWLLSESARVALSSSIHRRFSQWKRLQA